MSPEVWLRIQRDWRQSLPAVIEGKDDKIYPEGWAQYGAPPPTIGITAIYIAWQLKMPLSRILGDCQDKQTRRARLLLYALIRYRFPRTSITRMAERLGRDRTTVRSGLKAFCEARKTDTTLEDEYLALRAEL